MRASEEYHMSRLLREYVRSVLMLESVTADSTDGLAVFVGESFFNPDAKEAVIVDIGAFNAALKANKAKSSLFTSLDVAKFAAGESVVGYISVGPPLHGKAWGAWEVTRAAGKGYGKIIYSIGYALSPKGLLMPDRTSVSDDARDAWKKASKTHASLELDALPPMNKTDTREDDAEVHDEEGFEYLDRAYKATGDENDMLNRLLAAGENLEADLKKKFKGKEQQVIGRFLSAGSRLFSRSIR